MSSGPLRGLAVLVTRPAQQAANLCRLIEQAGGAALPLPLFAIEAAADAATAAALATAAAAAGLCIFTSANAVHSALRLHAGPWPAQAAATGAATAAALAAAGFAQVLQPAQDDGSPGLLAEAALARPAGRRILIVGGENPLPLLAETLRARGAEVCSVAVYRRVALAVEPAQLASLLGRAQAAVLTSAEALERLHQLAPAAARERLLQLQLAVASARVAERARALGFQRPPLVPARVADADFVAVLQDWRAGQ